MSTSIPTSKQLKVAWQALNAKRIVRGLPTFYYADLAHMVASPESADGEPMHCSKAIIGQIMADRYTAATAPAYRKRIAEIIRIRAADLDLAVLTTSTGRKQRRRPAQLHVVRCDPEGYIEFRGRTYYAGAPFRGSLCKVAPVKADKDKAVRISCDLATRIAYPVYDAPHQTPEVLRA